jgi:sporulation protein YlmC with PRC-barrel domain
MRVDRLRNLAVIDPETACRVGIVTDYWIDAAAGRVAALAIRPVDVDLSQHVDTCRVARVGRDAVAWCGREVLVVRTDEPAKLRPAGREDGFAYEATADALADGLSTSRDSASRVAA